MHTAVMLVLIWTSAYEGGRIARDTTVTTPALYFSTIAACETAIPFIVAQVKELNNAAQVSASCYNLADDPRG